MMNIFIMILVTLFMAAFYMLERPSARIAPQETDNAVGLADLRSVAECTSAAHNATIRGGDFHDICVEQNEIKSQRICLGTNLSVTKCDAGKSKKPAYSYIVTATAPLPDDVFSDMMDVLEENYADAGTFGIYQDGMIISGAAASKRKVPQGIISDLELTDGSLVYLTQYEIPDTDTDFATTAPDDIRCPAGTVRAYRFGRWQCLGYNTKTNCPGDTVWDADLYECVPDNTRKPLCANRQTAVLVDDVWECINPFPEKNCPDKMIAQLNYNTLEWECIEDPNITRPTKKCSRFAGAAVYGAAGATLSVQLSSCTDCEKMLTDPDTCVSVCVPDPARVNDPRCYAGGLSRCSDASHGVYFGFPDRAYAAQVAEIKGAPVPLDAQHNKNRRFNCLACPDTGIDPDKSFPPYIAVCKQGPSSDE